MTQDEGRQMGKSGCDNCLLYRRSVVVLWWSGGKCQDWWQSQGLAYLECRIGVGKRLKQARALKQQRRQESRRSERVSCARELRMAAQLST